MESEGENSGDHYPDLIIGESELLELRSELEKFGKIENECVLVSNFGAFLGDTYAQVLQCDPEHVSVQSLVSDAINVIKYHFSIFSTFH